MPFASDALLVSAADVARELGTTPAAVAALSQAGNMPKGVVRSGGQTWFIREAVEKWIANGAVEEAQDG